MKYVTTKTFFLTCIAIPFAWSFIPQINKFCYMKNDDWSWSRDHNTIF